MDRGQLGGRDGTKIGRARLRPWTVLRAVPFVRHGLPSPQQLDVVLVRPARTHEEVAGQKDSIQRNTDALGDGQGERAKPQAASAPVAQHRREPEEASVGTVDLSCKAQLVEHHGVDVVRELRVRATVTLLHAPGDVLQRCERGAGPLGIATQLGIQSDEGTHHGAGRGPARALRAARCRCDRQDEGDQRPVAHFLSRRCHPSA